MEKTATQQRGGGNGNCSSYLWILVAIVIVAAIASIVVCQHRGGRNGNDGAHAFPLVLAMACSTKGPVLEIGTNRVGTPMLHEMCRQKNRTIMTYMSSRGGGGGGASKAPAHLKTSWHAFAFGKACEEDRDPETQPGWGVAVVHAAHCRGKSRAAYLKGLRKNAEVVIVPNAEDTWIHGMTQGQLSKEAKKYKYHYRTKGCKPATWLLSNTVNVNVVGKHYMR